MSVNSLPQNPDISLLLGYFVVKGENGPHIMKKRPFQGQKRLSFNLYFHDNSKKFSFKFWICWHKLPYLPPPPPENLCQRMSDFKTPHPPSTVYIMCERSLTSLSVGVFYTGKMSILFRIIVPRICYRNLLECFQKIILLLPILKYWILANFHFILPTW